ncbi:MAG: hypothetical protein JNK83_11465 [Rhizobiales bacterium]|nr:hypothetical protein [Hyphomicrobiales bacterium]
MAESYIFKNLADKRKEILSYIGSLERDLEQARRDLSAIIATERVFQARGPKVTTYMELVQLFPRHELPRLCLAALAEASPISTKDIALYVIKEKNLDATDRYMRKAIAYRVCQVMRRWEKVRKVERVKKAGTAIVWSHIKGK